MIPDEPHRGGVPDAAFWARPGLEQIENFVSGLGPRPPLHYLTGMRPSAAGAGRSSFEMPASGWLAGPAGTILGGALAVLADGPLGCSIQSALPGGTPYTTTELALSYLRPAIPDGRLLTANGKLVHLGRSLGLSEVEVLDADGRLLAHGTSRCFVFPSYPVPDPPPPLTPVETPSYGTPDPWRRPVEGEVTPAEVWRTRDGLSIARAWVAGELPAPPVRYLTGQCVVAAEEGTARFTMPASGWLSSPAGTVEGGFLAMLADTALATAVQTTVPAGTAFAPIDVTVKFVRPVPPDGSPLTAEGRVVHRGRTMAVAAGEVRNAEGKLVVTAMSSALLFPGREMTVPVVPEDEPQRTTSVPDMP